MRMEYMYWSALYTLFCCQLLGLCDDVLPWASMYC